MLSLDVFVQELIKSVSLFKPETTLVITFVVAILADLIFKKSRSISGYIAILGFIVAGFFLAVQSGVEYKAFSNLLIIDGFGNFMKWIILLSSFFVVIISFFSKELYSENRPLGEYFSIIIGMTFGMFLLVSSANLIMIYLAVETMSLSSYILSGYTKEIKRSSEASLKYLIFGAVSSGIMLYGMSLVFGLTGSLNLHTINAFLNANPVSNFMMILSGLMILSGFAYKISAVPFHFWTPDVYEGAPVTITAYLSVASKAAGFAILLRFLKMTFIDTAADNTAFWHLVTNIDWQYIIIVLSVITMTFGNLTAIWQSNVKRLLAYSAIAHAGYLLMGVAVMNEIGVASILIYFLFYMFMNLGAFMVVMLIANNTGSEELDDYKGLGYRAPILGIAMTLFMISLTGLPPTAGFIGKLWIFSAVIDSGFLWLAVIGVVNSVISLFYYVKVFKFMYLHDVDSEKPALSYSPASIVVLMFFAIPTLLFGLWFQPIIYWANKSAMIFLGM